MRRKPFSCLSSSYRALLLLCACQSVALAQSEGGHALTVGGYLAKGDYGESLDTRIHYLPLSYEHSSVNWTLQATLPLLQVTGFGNVLVNVGGVTQAVASNDLVTERGVGDIVLTAIRHFDPVGDLFFDLRVDVKLPSANETKALGTGEVDFSTQLDVSANLGSAAVFSSVGYSRRGRSALYPGLNNSAYLQLGMAAPVSEDFSLGAFYDYRESASEFSPESHELTPYASWQLDESWSLTTLLVFGFTDASADQAIMAQLRYSW